MRFGDWECTLFRLHTVEAPLEEFKQECHYPDNNTSLPPTVTCYIPSLKPTTHLRICLHSWQLPVMLATSTLPHHMAALSPGPKYNVQVVIDGTLVYNGLLGLDTAWPKWIDFESPLLEFYDAPFPHRNRRPLRFSHVNEKSVLPTPDTLVAQQYRISVVLREILVGQAFWDGEVVCREENDLLCFSFLHASREVLVEKGIAWPKPNPRPRAAVTGTWPDIGMTDISSNAIERRTEDDRMHSDILPSKANGLASSAPQATSSLSVPALDKYARTHPQQKDTAPLQEMDKLKPTGSRKGQAVSQKKLRETIIFCRLEDLAKLMRKQQRDSVEYQLIRREYDQLQQTLYNMDSRQIEKSKPMQQEEFLEQLRSIQTSPQQIPSQQKFTPVNRAQMQQQTQQQLSKPPIGYFKITTPRATQKQSTRPRFPTPDILHAENGQDPLVVSTVPPTPWERSKSRSHFGTPEFEETRELPDFESLPRSRSRYENSTVEWDKLLDKRLKKPSARPLEPHGKPTKATMRGGCEAGDACELAEVTARKPMTVMAVDAYPPSGYGPGKTVRSSIDSRNIVNHQPSAPPIISRNEAFLARYMSNSGGGTSHAPPPTRGIFRVTHRTGPGLNNLAEEADAPSREPRSMRVPRPKGTVTSVHRPRQSLQDLVEAADQILSDDSDCKIIENPSALKAGQNEPASNQATTKRTAPSTPSAFKGNIQDIIQHFDTATPTRRATINEPQFRTPNMFQADLQNLIQPLRSVSPSQRISNARDPKPSHTVNASSIDSTASVERRLWRALGQNGHLSQSVAVQDAPVEAVDSTQTYLAAQNEHGEKRKRDGAADGLDGEVVSKRTRHGDDMSKL